MAAPLHQHAGVLKVLADDLERLYRQSSLSEKDNLDLQMEAFDELLNDPDRDGDVVKGAFVLFAFRLMFKELQL